MNLTGHQLLGTSESAESNDSFFAYNPTLREEIDPAFHEASIREIDTAVKLADTAFPIFRDLPPERRVEFLLAITEEVQSLGDALLERASVETAHPLPRCAAERDRVITHTRQFAELIREGSWLDARIDVGNPDRKPLPKPDVRSLMEAIGPITVFGASNFPIAISVLGTDTISAFAAGCPVIVKAHPAHPGTCELAARAILRAAARTRMPEGVFSLIQGRRNETSAYLVRHPSIEAVAFTGSLGGGRALFDIACSRPRPIPFYAEMGSVNPVFLLPGALNTRTAGIAQGFFAALTAGVGQFCTNPGLVMGIESPAWSDFQRLASAAVSTYAPATMLHGGIHQAYTAGIEARRNTANLDLIAQSSTTPDPEKTEAGAYLFSTTQQGLLADPTLLDELFGPTSTLVSCQNQGDFLAVAEKLEGSLSATIHGTEEDLVEYRDLVDLLRRKVGRLIFNGYPVGLEICHSMHHGGPYPATTISSATSIGTRAIQRFVRPICYQDWPDAQLPEALQNGNPRNLLRLVNGKHSRESIA